MENSAQGISGVTAAVEGESSTKPAPQSDKVTGAEATSEKKEEVVVGDKNKAVATPGKGKKADEKPRFVVETKSKPKFEKAKSKTTKAKEQEARVEIDLYQKPKAEISIRSLLQAGAHFGHQTSRWHPAMERFIYAARNGIHIIDLPKSLEFWKLARQAVIETTSRGGSVLFIGTKKQARDIIAEEAERCGSNYVSHRWLGGMLTNFQTIRHSVERMKEYQGILVEQNKLIEQGQTPKFTKKERLIMTREVDKLTLSLGGIRNMYRHPDMVFIVDIKKESIAVKEAAKLDIPVVALVDTNCDPNTVQHPVPANDDGTRAVKLLTEAVADAVIEGKRIMKERGDRISGSDSKRDERLVVGNKRPTVHEAEIKPEVKVEPESVVVDESKEVSAEGFKKS